MSSTKDPMLYDSMPWKELFWVDKSVVTQNIYDLPRAWEGQERGAVNGCGFFLGGC